ncbi:345_t:CDS:2, partial [Diversispora eburnea]
KNKKSTELLNCIKCDKKIFANPNKAFTILLCGHVFHKEFIKLDSQFSTSSTVGKMKKQLTIQSQEIINGEIPNIDNRENKNKVNSKKINTDIIEVGQKKPIEVTNEETSMILNKSPSKKTKIKKDESSILKKLIKNLTTDVPTRVSKNLKTTNKELKLTNRKIKATAMVRVEIIKEIPESKLNNKAL